MTRHRLAFLDLDGVICDDRHRIPFALRREWGMYFALIPGDAVWAQGRELYENAFALDYDIAYLTGRREDNRCSTTSWLDRNGFDADLPLIMRREDDRRPLAELKASIVAEALHVYDDVWLFDDDPRVIAEVSKVPGARSRHCTWHIKPERMVKKKLA